MDSAPVYTAGALPVIPPLLFPGIQGARLLLPLFRNRWLEFSRLCRSRMIAAGESVSMARHGFIPELTAVPVQFKPPPEPVWSAEVVAKMIPLHQDLLDTKIIHEVPTPDFSSKAVQMAAAMALCYYSGSPFLVPAVVMPFVHIWFTVPKPHSTALRPVSGMSTFNQWVIPRHFKMEGLNTVRQLLRPLDWMTVIDLKAAFPTMGIHPRYRDFFIFRFRGKSYRYSGAVFGISSLPRAFTKLLRPVIALLRSFGVRLCIFLDDILVMSSSYAQCSQDTQDVLVLLMHLGFVISLKEQVKLDPAQKAVWNGALICSLTMQFLLPPEKVRNVRKKLTKQRLAAIKGKLFSLRQWASVLGLMRSTQFAILPAFLWSQGVRRFVTRFVTTNKKCWDRILPEPPLEVLQNLDVFSRSLQDENGRPIRPTPAQLLSDTDASGFGGGIVTRSLPTQATAQWHWTQLEAQHHINWKELATHQIGLEALDLELPGLILNRFISNRTDNTVSMSYVNRQGGRVPKLSYLAEALWYYLLDRGCSIQDQFLAGKLNVEADTVSRWWIDVSEYKLTREIFLKLNSLWGPFTIDAFASRANKQIATFWSRHADPETAGRDAFRQDWRRQKIWAFPPYPLIARVLNQVRDLRITAAIIVPCWTSQYWFPLLLEMCLDWKILGPVQSVCHHPARPERSFLSQQKTKQDCSWNMAAFKICGNTFNSRVSVQHILTAFYAAGKTQK
jgi:hypothetical protein